MNDSIQSAKKVFTRFSPFIRDYIYRSGWDELRQIQIKAAELIFDTEDHVLISADTATGKSEAAFFPILTMMKEQAPENFQVLYISPLKSLINDQYSRMELLLKESQLPVYRWHGDVSQSQKHSFLKEPKGLLQITPESLESLLCRRQNDIPRILGNLKFIIIDEIHALMGSDRGYQIVCQLQRIAKLISYEPRRIGLSATLGEGKFALDFLSSGGARRCVLLPFKNESISWKLGLEHFFVTEETNVPTTDPASTFIYKATKGEKCVIFSNSREETEEICSSLRQIAQKVGEDDRFYIHHGNLSSSIREEAEHELKYSEAPITACSTATLELGIDIGKLKRIINQGAPTSVSGFLQRLGRSGRRGDPPEMLMVFRENKQMANAPIFQLIPWELLQGIAIIELYRKQRWIEDAKKKILPASLLFHQTLSILAGYASLSAPSLAAQVLELAPFFSVTKDDYKSLLIHMLKNDYLELTDEGELIVGLRGEKLLSSFKFYSVFKDSDDFTVRCGSEELGKISTTPPTGEHFALAGRVWEVTEIDLTRKLVFCKKADGKMKISWPGQAGSIHTKILEEMRRVLCSDEAYPYLLPAAAVRLKKARQLCENAKIKSTMILPLGGNSFVLFPWLGTCAFQTLKKILQTKITSKLSLHDIQSAGCYYITFKAEHATADQILECLNEFCKNDSFSTEELLLKSEPINYDKYDLFLPDSLQRKSYALNRLDFQEVQNRFLN